MLNVLKVPKITTLSLNTHPDTPVNHAWSWLNSSGLLSTWFAVSKCNEAIAGAPVGLDLEMLWGIVVEYNWSFDRGSNDRNAFSLYGWKGEAHRKFVNINTMTFPKIQHVVLTKLQLWTVRWPSKIRRSVPLTVRNIASHIYGKCQNLLPKVQRGFTPNHKWELQVLHHNG